MTVPTVSFVRTGFGAAAVGDDSLLLGAGGAAAWSPSRQPPAVNASTTISDATR